MPLCVLMRLQGPMFWHRLRVLMRVLGPMSWHACNTLGTVVLAPQSRKRSHRLACVYAGPLGESQEQHCVQGGVVAGLERDMLQPW